MTPQGFVVREMVAISREELQGKTGAPLDVRAGLQAAHRAADRGGGVKEFVDGRACPGHPRLCTKEGVDARPSGRIRPVCDGLWPGMAQGMDMNFIEANGVSLRYAVQGSGKPLVLIHEMGGTMESWELVVPALSAKRRVVRYDTRGAGFSEKIRGPLTIDTMTDDLIALLDALGITEKVALAGTAVGGAIALHTAFRFPERVAAAIVTSPATSIPPANREAVLARVAKFETEGVRSVVEATADNGYPEELRGDRARFEGFRARWLANDPSSFAAIYRMLADMDLSPELAHDQVPGAGNRRRVRPRPSATPGRADRAGDPRRAVQGAARRALCGFAGAGADGARRSRRFWIRSDCSRELHLPRLRGRSASEARREGVVCMPPP